MASFFGPPGGARNGWSQLIEDITSRERSGCACQAHSRAFPRPLPARRVGAAPSRARERLTPPHGLRTSAEDGRVELRAARGGGGARERVAAAASAAEEQRDAEQRAWRAGMRLGAATGGSGRRADARVKEPRRPRPHSFGYGFRRRRRRPLRGRGLAARVPLDRSPPARAVLRARRLGAHLV